MVCCVTGHRPGGFPFPREQKNEAYLRYLEKLEEAIRTLIGQNFRSFISGMAEGADLDFASCVITLRDQGFPISLEAALPYPIPPRKYNSSRPQSEREALLGLCDTVTAVSPYYFRGCMQKRNRYMVDRADMVLAVWNGEERGGTWNTIDYAISRNKEIRYIHLSNLL